MSVLLLGRHWKAVFLVGKLSLGHFTHCNSMNDEQVFHRVDLENLFVDLSGSGHRCARTGRKTIFDTVTEFASEKRQ